MVEIKVELPEETKEALLEKKIKPSDLFAIFDITGDIQEVINKKRKEKKDDLLKNK